MIDHLLSGATSALDVGAGFGALAVPVAERLDRVTAVEPSHAMVEGLRDEIRRHGLTNVTVIEAAWGDVALEPHDIVLCAHVGPLLSQEAFLGDALRLARRAVVLVRDVPDDDHDKFFFSELYPLLLGRTYDRCCDYAETLEVLARLGVKPTVTRIEYASDQPFDSLEEACEFWMEYMNLTGDGDRATLRRFLERRLTRHGNGLVAPFPKRAAVIHWEIAP